MPRRLPRLIVRLFILWPVSGLVVSTMHVIGSRLTDPVAVLVEAIFMRCVFLCSTTIAALLVAGCTSSMPTPPDAETAAQNPFETTTTGLRYRVLREGTGPKPGPTDTVRVHYRGWLPNPGDGDNGTEFDSSYGRGEPISFPLNGVIPGWTEGVQLIGEGGMIELEVPSELGYGAQGAGGVIPPNATLRFVVELLGPVKPGPTDHDAPEDFTVTDSGLRYRILRKGDGPKPGALDKVTVHYRGWMPDESDPSTGTEFDSSYGRGEPTSFPLNAVIPGWTEGLQLVNEGGMIELDVPAKLGYGQSGFANVIPPNADLRFQVELIKIE